MAELGDTRTLRFASHHLPSPPHVPPPTIQSLSPTSLTRHANPEALDQVSANDLFSHAVLLFHAIDWHESIILHRRIIRRLTSSLSSSSSTTTASRSDSIPPSAASNPGLSQEQGHEHESWIKPMIGKLWFNIGILRGHLGEYALAIEAFNRSAQVNPDCPITWFCLGAALFEIGDFRKALRRFKRCWGFFRVRDESKDDDGDADVLQQSAPPQEQTEEVEKKKTEKKEPKKKLGELKRVLDFHKDGLKFAIVREKLEFNIRLCLLWKLHKQVNSERPLPWTLSRLPAGILFEPLEETEVVVEEAAKDEEEVVVEEAAKSELMGDEEAVEDEVMGDEEAVEDEEVVDEEPRPEREERVLSRRYTIPRTITTTTHTPPVTILDPSSPSMVEGRSSSPLIRLPTRSSSSPTTEQADPTKEKKRDKLPLLKGLHFPKRLFQRRGTFPRHTTTTTASGQDEVTSGLPGRDSGSRPSRSGLLRGYGLLPVRMHYISPPPPYSPAGATTSTRSRQPRSDEGGERRGLAVYATRVEGVEGVKDVDRGSERQRIDSFALMAPEETRIRLPVYGAKRGKKGKEEEEVLKKRGVGRLFKPLPPLPEHASHSSTRSSLPSRPTTSEWVSSSVFTGRTPPLQHVVAPLPPGYSPPSAPTRFSPPPPPPPVYPPPRLPSPPTGPSTSSLRRKRVTLPTPSSISSTSLVVPIFPPASSVLHNLLDEDDASSKDEEAVEGQRDGSPMEVRSTAEMFSPETYLPRRIPPRHLPCLPSRETTTLAPPPTTIVSPDVIHRTINGSDHTMTNKERATAHPAQHHQRTTPPHDFHATETEEIDLIKPRRSSNVIFEEGEGGADEEEKGDEGEGEEISKRDQSRESLPPRHSYILARRASTMQKLEQPRDDTTMGTMQWPERSEMARVIWGGS